MKPIKFNPNDPKLWKDYDPTERATEFVDGRNEKQINISKALKIAWQDSELKQKHKASIRQVNAIDKEIIKKIFFDFYKNEILDDISFKKNISKKYGISISHVQKICSARSSYIHECIGLTVDEINNIKKVHLETSKKYKIRTFGVDILNLYNTYSYKSKFSVDIVWQYRFGKYKNMKKRELEKHLNIKITRYDIESLQKSYSWLTDTNSSEIYYGNSKGAYEFVKILPTKKEKFKFIKTGKYEGCLITIE